MMARRADILQISIAHFSPSLHPVLFSRGYTHGKRSFRLRVFMVEDALTQAPLTCLI